jgi:hypothetical protein
MEPQRVSIRKAFETAVNDGINAYMWDVVRRLGFISKADHERLGELDMLKLKYAIASQLAQQWARAPLTLEDNEAWFKVG